ncbi:MAG: M1 family aminopeptidase [Balneolaceae bacterium]|nr:M1 family aminopeptidase [Balneolaceae bacterium]
MIRWSDYHYPGPAYGVASYPKPASGLSILRAILGEETFHKAYRTFIEEWKYKHPYPWDLFNVFENVSGRDLDWFWRSFYYRNLDPGPERRQCNTDRERYAHHH